MPPESKAVLSWLQKADDDLRLGEMAMKGSPPVCWGAAFHAQQAAEKALKGLLTHHGRELEKTHDIRYLLQLCEAVAPSLRSVAERAVVLTRYAVQPRYAVLRPDPSESEALRALALAREILELVRKAMPADLGRGEERSSNP